MNPRPRPLLGLLLGLLLGAAAVGLLWQLGLVDPGRTMLFVTVAVVALVVTGLLTRQISAARGRFVSVAVLAGILAGVGLTGIPELVSVGRVSDGCTLEATAGGLTAAPADTSAFTAFTVGPDDVVEWTMTAAEPIAVDTRMAGIRVGGFDIPVRTVTSDPALPEATEVSGTVDVAAGLDSIRDRTGLELSGVYHVYGEVSGETGLCRADGWVLLEPAGLFATNVLVGLWITIGVLLLLIAWAAFAVRASFVQARRAVVEGERVHTGTVTTAAGVSLAGGAGAGHVAADAEPSGTTSPEEAAEPVAPAPAFTPEARPEEMPPARIAPAPAGVGAGAGAAGAARSDQAQKADKAEATGKGSATPASSGGGEPAKDPAARAEAPAPSAAAAAPVEGEPPTGDGEVGSDEASEGLDPEGEEGEPDEGEMLDAEPDELGDADDSEAGSEEDDAGDEAPADEDDRP